MRSNDVAIIGVSCVFPGSKNYEEYWDNLLEKKCSISEIGKDRWDVKNYYSQDFSEKNKACSKWCGLIRNIYDFDNEVFHISRREAEVMDPQQRMLLQETWHCIEDAGVSFTKLREQTTSVYVGTMNCDYRQELYSDNAAVDGYYTLGSFENMLANRISHCFGLNGCSTTLNAACASSLVAVDYAVNALVSESTDYAIAAAANLNVNPFKYLSFSKARMLSPNGLCRTFDANADGYVPGDGIAVLLLQKLELAKKQGNKIYGVIKGVSVGHNGGALTVTAPRIDSQVKVITEAYKKAHLNPDEISYVETHGTGTSLGDPIEISALEEVFKRSNASDKCYIGSVKTSIGHLESASGMAGIIKVLMMMKYHQIPVTINTRGDNAVIRLDHTHFVLNSERIDWNSKDGRPLRAGISSFGFGGTNAHIILEEYIEKRESAPDQSDQILVLSANTMEAAVHMKDEWNEKADTYQSQDYSNVLKTALNIDRNQKVRYAKIIRYGESLKIGEDVSFKPVQEHKTQILVLERVEKGDYQKYMDLKKKFYLYAEIVDRLSSKLKRHKVKVKLDVHVDQISEEQFKLNSFILGYGFAQFLKEIGVPFHIVSWDRQGLFVMLAFMKIYQPVDIALNLLGKSSLQKADIGLQDGIVIDGEKGNRIYPFELDKLQDNYNKFIRQPLLEADKDLIEDYLKRYYNLIENQYTFRNYILEWEKSLQSTCGLTIEKLIASEEVWHKKCLLVIMYDTFRRLKVKWGIKVEDKVEDFEIRYFLEMIANQILSIDEFINLLFYGTEVEAAQLEQRALEYLSEHGTFQVYTASSAWNENVLAELSLQVFKEADKELHSIALSELVDQFEEGLIGYWNSGCDIRFDKLYQEGSYQKKSMNRQFFVKNYFPKPFQKEHVHVYREDDTLIEDHNIAGKHLVPGADFMIEMMRTYHMDCLHNILFMKAAFINEKEEYIIQKKKDEEYHIVNMESQEEVFVCNKEDRKQKEAEYLENQDIKKEYELSEIRFYESLRRSGYNYGKSLQLLHKLSESESHYIFQLKVTADTGSVELLDNAFQGAIALAGIVNADCLGITYLPYYIEHFEYNQELYGNIEVWIPKNRYKADKNMIRTDIRIVQNQKVLSSIQGMVLKSNQNVGENAITYKMEWVDSEFKSAELAEHFVIMGKWKEQETVIKNCCKVSDVQFVETVQDSKGFLETLAEDTKIYWFCDANPEADIKPEEFYGTYLRPFLTFLIELSKMDKKLGFFLVCSGKSPYEATLKGIVKALKKEKHTIETGIYVLEQYGKAQIQQMLQDSIENSECEVLFGSTRKVKQLVTLDVKDDQNEFIKSNGVYIIIGGTGGIGREIGKLLLKEKNAKIVLTGRNSRSSYIDEIITYVAENEGECVYYPADICDKAQMDNLIKQVKERFGHIDGMIHSAVEMVDMELKNLNNEMFEQGLQCKYYGAVTLADICKENDIHSILFFSSILTYTGNKGQASYLAGCNFLEEYAQYLNTAGLNAKVINWGYWSETGIAKNARFGNILKEWNIGKLKIKEALSQFIKAMASQETQIVIAKMNEKEEDVADVTAEKLKSIDSKANEKKEYLPEKKDKKKNTSVTSNTEIKKLVIEDISQLVCSLTHNDEVLVQTPFSQIGIESIVGVELVNQISSLFGIQLSQTIIFDYPTILKMSEAIYKRYKEAVEAHYHRVEEMNVEETDTDEIIQDNVETNAGTDISGKEIAIVGMSCRIGGTDNVEELWEALMHGRNLVTEIPKDRWGMEGFYDSDRSNKQRSYCKWGSFLNDVYGFEPSFFHITPKEAKYMDPQQRVLMEESYKALEDAGYSYEMLDGIKCGAFYGIMNNDYREILGAKAENVDYGLLLSGNSNAILSARTSYMLNLKGPAFTLDTACSSSLVAMHLGCQAIQNGDADMMIIGGTTLYLSPEYYVQMCGLSMLSPRGMCSTFDQKADGFVPGEGAGVIVLKQLDRAIKDKDHIYGVIKGSGCNQDGATNGITAPSKESQKELELEVYQNAGINPETIGMVEAHGTGTKLGDPIEVEALTESYRAFTQKENYCAIGSLKTYTGHTLAAAGVASIIKVLLCMKHKKLVPSLHYEKNNEFIDFDNSPFYLPKTVTEWKVEEGKKRRAAVSSFGFSGTNVHVVIEEAEQAERQNAEHSLYVLPLSAKTSISLKQNLERLISWLSKEGNDEILNDLQYTLIMRRNHFQYRCAVVVKDIKHAVQELEKVKRTLENSAVNVTNSYLLSEEEIHSLLRKEHLTEAEWKELCEASSIQFVNGGVLDWSDYYKSKQCRCLSLPVYQFHKQSCRAEFMLQDNMQKDSVTDREKFSKKYEFLKDHMVNMQNVVPAAFILKMAVDAYRESDKKEIRILEDVFFQNRILLSDVGVKAYIKDVNKEKQFTIENRSQKKVYSIGKMKEDTEYEFQSRKVPTFKTKKIMEQEECYEILENLGLHYTNGFRCIKKVQFEGKCLVGKLHAENQVETYIVDGALQAAALLAKELNELVAAAIPVSIQKVHYFSPIETDCYIRIENFLSGIDNSFDIFIMNQYGKVCMFLENTIIHTEWKSMDENSMLEMLKKLYEGTEDIDDVIERMK